VCGVILARKQAMLETLGDPQNEIAKMDSELRQLIEIARVEAEFAFQELQHCDRVQTDAARCHIEKLVIQLEEFLKRTKFRDDPAGPPGRRH